MHTEEAYLGLFVSNPAGERWVVYGSERALEEAARDNLQRCVAAVQASVDEVYAAFTTKDIVAQNGYKAWIIAPVSASIWQEKNFAPLFKCRDGVSKDLLRRQDIGNRRKNHYTKDWTPQSTAIACGEVWRYGLHLESPKVAPFSHIAVAMPWLWHARLYYQDCSGGVLESLRRTDGWVEGADQSPLWTARHRSPFAVINFDGGRRVRRNDTSDRIVTYVPWHRFGFIMSTPNTGYKNTATIMAGGNRDTWACYTFRQRARPLSPHSHMR